MSGGRKPLPSGQWEAETYDVGYGKPPKSTQFRKGRSGNPSGRPKGAKNKQSARNIERLKDIILEEAYRDIPVRDGGGMVAIPVAQAVVRTMSINAAKGQHRAQRLFTELLGTTERSRKNLRDQWMETTIEYKLNWEKELLRRERLGITGLPEPLPHPDHIEIDLVEETARIIGPTTKEEKAVVDELVQDMDQQFVELREILKAREAATSSYQKRKFKKALDEKLEFIGWLKKIAPKKESAEDD